MSGQFNLVWSYVSVELSMTTKEKCPAPFWDTKYIWKYETEVLLILNAVWILQ